MRRRTLRAHTLPTSELGDETREAMWRLFERYYADVDRARFLDDLSRKRDVVLLKDPVDDSVQGFCNLQVYPGVAAGRPYVAVFTGDTVIDPAYHGQTKALHRAFFNYLVACKLRQPRTMVFWYLVSKGYKTYLTLTRNVPVHWPRHDLATPAFEAAVLDDLGRRFFASAWRPDRGVLCHPDAQGRLKEHVAPIGEAELRHAEIRFFVDRNPGYATGDELCCLGLVDRTLLTHFTAKVLRRALGLT
jgi:hypothetical protein